MSIYQSFQSILFGLLFIAFGLNLLSGQSRNYRRYETQQVHQRLLRENPEMQARIEQIDSFVNSNKTAPFPNKITIPVVFHVLFKTGQEYPEANQIYAQIEALNRDFNRDKSENKHPADTKERFNQRVAKMDIEFCLPKEDPTGDKNKLGIQYIQVNRKSWNTLDDMKSSEKGGVEPWDPTAYLNIYVVNLARNLSGYAQMPGGPVMTDGIVIDFDFFGLYDESKSRYNEGKTLTHLVGSYLGLYELWNSIDRCSDDKVEDTPIHNAPNHNWPGYIHISTCPNNLSKYQVEMTMNFMDNTLDSALYMFTQGQKARMRAMLIKGGPRYLLTQTKVKCNIQNSSLAEDLFRNEDLIGGETIKIYPNPAKQELNIDIRFEETKTTFLQIINAQGQAVFSMPNLEIPGRWQQTIDISSWPGGIYLIRLLNDNQQYTEQLIISQND